MFLKPLSKIVFQSLINIIPNRINLTTKYSKNIWENSNSKKGMELYLKKYKNGDLKNVEIPKTPMIK